MPRKGSRSRRKIRGRSRRTVRRSHAGSLLLNDDSVEILEYRGSNSGVLNFNIDHSKVSGMSIRLSSFDIVLLATKVSSMVQLTILGSAEERTTKTILVGSLPKRIKLRTSRFADFEYISNEGSVNPSLMIMEVSAEVNYVITMRLVKRPARKTFSLLQGKSILPDNGTSVSTMGVPSTPIIEDA